MTIQEVYDKFKHLDEHLTKRKYMSDIDSIMISAMWEAIKDEVEKEARNTNP